MKNTSSHTLDAHAHLNHAHDAHALEEAGAVLAMTLSLEEAAGSVSRTDRWVAWGVGCHPADANAQRDFDVSLFADLAERTVVVGEIGLDKRSGVPFERQVEVFRSILEVARDHPRILSIHSNHATAEVLDELARQPPAAAILHWWNGSNSKTRLAVDLGCFFSVNRATALYSRLRTIVPRDRILVETDCAHEDPPGQIPAKIEAAEELLAGTLQIAAPDVRRLAWENMAALVRKVQGQSLLPEGFREVIASIA